jgi:hypothetical protein
MARWRWAALRPWRSVIAFASIPSTRSLAICALVPKISILPPLRPSVTSKPASASFSRFCGVASTR